MNQSERDDLVRLATELLQMASRLLDMAGGYPGRPDATDASTGPPGPLLPILAEPRPERPASIAGPPKRPVPGFPRLEFDPAVCDDSPVVKGTWVTCRHVLSLVCDGWTWSDVLRTHPELYEDDLRECLAYTVACEHDAQKGQIESQD